MIGLLYRFSRDQMDLATSEELDETFGGMQNTLNDEGHALKAYIELLRQYSASQAESDKHRKTCEEQTEEIANLRMEKDALRKSYEEQAEEIAKLQKKIEELQAELDRLKKLPKKPKFRKSEKPDDNKNDKGKKGSTSGTNVTGDRPPKKHEDLVVRAEGVPPGSEFRGYKSYWVQEIDTIAKDMQIRMEIWRSPDGKLITADLPAWVKGHYGPDLRAQVHQLYAHGMTQPCIHSYLQNLGLEISEAQVHYLLMDEAEAYAKEAEKILEAGLASAPYIRVDDTGGLHGYKNCVSTHIGGEFFAYYKTTGSKSRENFLNLLSLGQHGWMVNDAMIWHLFCAKVEDDVLNLLEQHQGTQFQTEQDFEAFLDKLCLWKKRLRKVCAEGAWIGFIQHHCLAADQILLSDRAPQFGILDHAACWVHMERPLRKLIASTPELEQEIKTVRDAIWNLYRQVQEASVTQEGMDEARAAFQALVNIRVESPGVQAVLDSFREYEDELLKALDHPGLPLHNNASEQDIRGMVRFRKISGSTKSEEGKAFRDSMMTIKHTCRRLGISYWEFCRAWFRGEPISLADRIREHYQAQRDSAQTAPP
jgi:hypothetical protein